MTAITGPWLWETSGKPFLRQFTFTCGVELEGPRVAGTEPYIMNPWSTWSQEGTWVTWRSTASRFMATVCTLTPMQSRTWFCSWTTRTLRDRRIRLCCSCSRSGTGWTGFPHPELSLWTSSLVCCAIDWNCLLRMSPESKQRCRLLVPSSPSRRNTKLPNYVAKRKDKAPEQVSNCWEHLWSSAGDI